MPAKDEDSLSDPYLKIILMGKTYDFEKEHLNDQTNPDFYKYIEFQNVSLPGASDLQI